MNFLYLKTHEETGLKYVGKTIKDPFEYRGSGRRWIAHLNKHGNNVHTEILFASNNKELFKRIALEYSKKHNIVDDPEYANLMDEQGQGGIPTNAFPKGHVPWSKGKKNPSASKAKKAYWERWKADHPNHKEKWKCNQRKPKDEWIRADNTSKINAKIVECPHCGKKGNYPNMKRWHFENCKHA